GRSLATAVFENVGDHHRRSGLTEGGGDFGAQTARRAGDQCDLAGQRNLSALLGHECPPELFRGGCGVEVSKAPRPRSRYSEAEQPDQRLKARRKLVVS